MNSVNKTLYIPLYGKALVSQKGVILTDKKAEEIWEKAGFPLNGKAKSKWLAYYMGMRSAVFDAWVQEKITEKGDSVVLHLGCGLDSRIARIGAKDTTWYDVDFEAVINERRRYYEETANYRMLAADIKDSAFLQTLPNAKRAIVILEGVSMYLSNAELKQMLKNLNDKFSHLSVLMDCYTLFAAKMSKIKNPVRGVGVTTVYGIENPQKIVKDTGLKFIKEHELTPQYLIDQLQGCERRLFKTLYAGKTSKKLYKLYEYES